VVVLGELVHRIYQDLGQAITLVCDGTLQT
jgi:hypothetical protein